MFSYLRRMTRPLTSILWKMARHFCVGAINAKELINYRLFLETFFQLFLESPRLDIDPTTKHRTRSSGITSGFGLEERANEF